MSKDPNTYVVYTAHSSQLSCVPWYTYFVLCITNVERFLFDSKLISDPNDFVFFS